MKDSREFEKFVEEWEEIRLEEMIKEIHAYLEKHDLEYEVMSDDRNNRADAVMLLARMVAVELLRDYNAWLNR